MSVSSGSWRARDDVPACLVEHPPTQISHPVVFNRRRNDNRGRNVDTFDTCTQQSLGGNDCSRGEINDGLKEQTKPARVNEKLIESPVRELRRMLEFVGVPYDPSCLDFHTNRRAVQTPSAQQVRRPINPDGIDAWRPYEPWLRDLKDALGPALEKWMP